MSIFEAIMLLCFGAAWPASIYRSYVSRDNSGKSLWFMVIVLIGYISGVTHKLIYSYDLVIYLYILNGLMVSADILLYYRNSRLTEESDSEMKSN
ncbi:hypothetical protein [Acetohalobium arabaticum]|uniref:PQ loop repeat protein n=1 Tax=Acetohalobium arabaticum (strain ATCC 49924 / DSM 5501 / Z-7288) TaxID=574087 RepID=D9QPU1_ACEAZ|nr:hypothetical protein [Acetohalobium arabaticum]ADL12532.1 conserved hypothetical protein [Acetohalobium arabaticum DSM 5501]